MCGVNAPLSSVKTDELKSGIKILLLFETGFKSG